MQKIITRTVNGTEFKGLIDAAGLNINDTIRITGLNALAILSIIKAESKPRMSDIILLDFLGENPDLVETMLEISDRYCEENVGTSAGRLARRMGIRNG